MPQTYEKTLWERGDIITATRMNHIEDGIYNLHTGLSELDEEVAKVTEMGKFSCPGTIYGVIGHPFSLYYYDILNVDNIANYHITVEGLNSAAREHVLKFDDKISFLCDEEEAAEYTLTLHLRKNTTLDIDTKIVTIKIQQDLENFPTRNVMFLGGALFSLVSLQAELVTMCGGVSNFIVNGDGSNFNPKNAENETISIPRNGTAGTNYKMLNTSSNDNNTTNYYYNPEKPQNSHFDFSYGVEKYQEEKNLDFSVLTDVFLMPGNNSVSEQYQWIQKIYESIHEYNENIHVYLLTPMTVVPDGPQWWTTKTFDQNRNARITFLNTMLSQELPDYVTLVPVYINLNADYDYETQQYPVTFRQPNITVTKTTGMSATPNRYGQYSMADIVYAYLVKNNTPQETNG